MMPSKGSKTSRAKVKLVHFIVCDEVRIEAKTHKAIYIGVYNGTIIGGADPVVLDRLTLIFAFRSLAEPRPSTARLELSGPKGSALPPALTFLLRPENPEIDTSSIIAELRTIQLATGRYTATLRLNDTDELRGEFDVRSEPEVIARRRE